MIRLANKHDTTEIINMMKAFRQEANISFYKTVDNEKYWHQLLSNIYAGQGYIFLAEGKGLLMSLIVPSVWCNKTYGLHELAWYVKPEFRHTTTGFRLMQEYIKLAKQLKDSGRISYVCLSKLPNTPELKYDKYGFKKLDENWVM